MLNKIRTETLNHPKLDERVKLCQPSYDLRSWWICGQHDRDLLIGAARYVFKSNSLQWISTCTEKQFHLTIYRLNGNGMRQFLLCFGRHGVVRTDYHILFDPNLSFIDVLKTKQATSHSSSPLPTKGSLRSSFKICFDMSFCEIIFFSVSISQKWLTLQIKK